MFYLDHIVLGTDGGRIVILAYNPEKQILEKVHQETFGKTGCRRIVPGQMLAVDPGGRAIMLGAIEKNKYVYVLNRDADMKLTISSPLESIKSLLMCYTMVGLDVGFDNPAFACIEVDCADSDADPTGESFKEIEKLLTFYELDLGLNHVVRKWSQPIDPTANHLIPVPGGQSGPSGVLVCSERFITWIHPDFKSVRVPIPQRPDPLRVQADPDGVINGEGVVITCSVLHQLKKKKFFILLQTDLGDVFKLTMNVAQGIDGAFGQVEEIHIKYFETLPVATQIGLFKAGFLFLAAEFGNHTLYQIENLGDDEDDQPTFSSADFDEDSMDTGEAPLFIPRELRNLSPVDEMESLAPVIDSHTANLTSDDTPQIYALCGRGSRSTFRILRHGLDVSEIAVSELPGRPNNVWTIKGSAHDQFDRFIVISFTNATLVLSIGETVEEVTDTGLLVSTATLAVGLLGDDALVQVHMHGIRHIRADRRVSEWRAPIGTTIIKATNNQRQVAVALSNSEIIYFELDASGNLNEFQEHREMSSAVTTLSMSPLLEGRQRAPFLAIGCADNTVRILSLDTSNCMEPISMQALSAAAQSLIMTEMIDPTTGLPTLFLNIGLTNGVLLRTSIDNVTGALADTRLRYLGAKAVKLFPITVGGASGVLALSTRPWIAYTYHSRYRLVPLSYESLEYGANFCSELCAEGLVAVAGNTLRILQVDRLNHTFNQVVYPLSYTPRRMLLDEASKNFIILEADHNTWSPSEKKKLLKSSSHKELDPAYFGLPRAGNGKWASCIRIFSPFSGETLQLIELDHNEAAISISRGTFSTHPKETFYLIGSVKDMTVYPKSFSTGYVSVYRLKSDGSSLELVHKV